MRKSGCCSASFAEDVARAHDGVLAVGAGLAVEAERILEIEGDDGRARELQQEIAQRADGDAVGDGRALGFGRFGVARVHFGARGGFQAIEQVVGLDALSLAAADLDVGLARVLLGERVAHFGGAARRERHHLVGKVSGARGLVVEAERAQAGDDHVLQVRLARVNHVEYFGAAAEGRARRLRRRWRRWSTERGRRRRCESGDRRNPGRAGRTSTADRRCPCRRR